MKHPSLLSTSYTSHPVARYIHDRRHGKRGAGRLALVVEGGGMRGAITGAMVAELESLGIGPQLFDSIIGTSAGAFNAAYYIAGQARHGVQIYATHLKEYGFVNYYRWLYGRPIMNHDILVDHIMDAVVPIDWQKVVQSKKFYAVATNPMASQQHTVLLGAPRSTSQLKQFLRASAHIPVVAGRPPLVEGARLYDGGMTAMLPIDQALDLGATHILALSARSLEGWKSQISRLERLLLGASRVAWPDFTHALQSRVARNSGQSQELARARLLPETPPYILVLDCPPLVNVRRFEKNATTIAHGAAIGRQVIQAAFA